MCSPLCSSTSLSHLPLIAASPSLCSWLFILKGCSVWVYVERQVTSLRLLPFSLPLLNYPWLPLANYHQILESEIHTYAHTHTHYYSALQSHWQLKIWDITGLQKKKKKREREIERERYQGTSSRCLYFTVKTSLCSNYIYFSFLHWIVGNYNE